MAFSDGLTGRGGAVSRVFSIDYAGYEYVERQRLDHPYDDSFYTPPLKEPLYFSGALIEQAIDNDELTRLHLADLTHLDDDTGMGLLLQLVRSRTWKFVELGARHREGVDNMFEVLDALIAKDNCEQFAGGCLFENDAVANRLCDLLHTTQKLRYLKLWGKISAETANRFAEQIAACTTLQKVELGHMAISDPAAKRGLVDAVWNNCSIQYLFLYYSASHFQPIQGIWEKLATQQEQEDQRRTFRYAYVPDCQSHHL